MLLLALQTTDFFCGRVYMLLSYLVLLLCSIVLLNEQKQKKTNKKKKQTNTLEHR
jgi:hypothetical protein